MFIPDLTSPGFGTGRERDYILNNLGAALLETDRFREAEEPLLRALALDPSRAYAWLCMASYFSKQDTQDKASGMFSTAIDFAIRTFSVKPNWLPDWLRSRSQTANHLVRQNAADAFFNAVVPSKSPDRAIVSLSTMVERDPDERVKQAARRALSETAVLIATLRTLPGAAAVDRRKYSIQVGAFSAPDNVARLESELKQKGYETFTKEDASSGNTIYRVLVGQFVNRGAAEMTRLRIIGQERIKTVIDESEGL